MKKDIREKRKKSKRERSAIWLKKDGKNERQKAAENHHFAHTHSCIWVSVWQKTRPESGSFHPSLFWKILKNIYTHNSLYELFLWMNMWVYVVLRSERLKHWSIQQSLAHVCSVRNTLGKGESMLCKTAERARGKERARKNRWNHRKITNECFTKVGGAQQYIFI